MSRLKGEIPRMKEHTDEELTQMRVVRSRDFDPDTMDRYCGKTTGADYWSSIPTTAYPPDSLHIVRDKPTPEYLVDFNDGVHQRSTYITNDPRPNSPWFDITLWVREGDTFRKLTNDEVEALRPSSGGR